ncbi:hypothetical protein E2C01_067144 [Portunus trituberculatus]|uniref:Uncharacterized protein n=1 Tax=Portunus trituberculatus TaxID=210409 RepID=A0A5B7HK73_PORTR|nr:hypothetical protein [Portunus trituberculatus]
MRTPSFLKCLSFGDAQKSGLDYAFEYICMRNVSDFGHCSNTLWFAFPTLPSALSYTFTTPLYHATRPTIPRVQKRFTLPPQLFSKATEKRCDTKVFENMDNVTSHSHSRLPYLHLISPTPSPAFPPCNSLLSPHALLVPASSMTACSGIYERVDDPESMAACVDEPLQEMDGDGLILLMVMRVEEQEVVVMVVVVVEVEFDGWIRQGTEGGDGGG